MSLRCDMQLDRPSGVYQAGDVVKGHIYLTLPERELVKAIALEACGYAVTAWEKPQKQKKGKPKPALPYGQRLDYLASINYFVGSEQAIPNIIEAGVYHYPFTVHLPEQCPSSYEGALGHIRYTLQLMLHTDTACQVVHSRRLELLHLGKPLQSAGVCDAQHLEQTPRLKFWQRPLLLELNIPRAEFMPGDGISVHVKLHNPQQLPLSELIYKLNQLVTYKGHQSGKPKRSDTKLDRCNLMSSVHHLNDVPRKEQFQHLHLLQVPPTTPTLDFTECQIMQLSYEVEVILKTKQNNRFIMAQLPVAIMDRQRPIIVDTPVLPICQGTNLTVARSMDYLDNIDLDKTLEATAPAITPTAETDDPNLSRSMISLASNFREAEFMVSTNLNKQTKHAMSGEQLDFKPRYLYYEMEHTEAEKTL